MSRNGASSGRVGRKHAAFAPASQKRLGSRLRSPLPTVKEPCPLSLSHGFRPTLPSLYDKNSISVQVKFILYKEESWIF